MKKYLAILSVALDDNVATQNHIARSVGNGIDRHKLFTLYMLARGKKHYDYRVCRVITDRDIKNTSYCEESRDQWIEHLKAHTERVRKWLRRKTTKVIEKNKQTLALLEDL